MQYFDRSDVPRPATSRVQAPASLVGPDGQLCIGLPAAESRAAADAARGGAGDAAAAGGIGTVQLLYPCTATVDPSPRLWLHGVLAVDVGVLVYMLSRVDWDRQGLEVDVGWIGVAGLVADAFGFCVCESRRPTLLGFFAAIVGVQFMCSALVLLTPVRAQPACVAAGVPRSVRRLVVFPALRVSSSFSHLRVPTVPWLAVQPASSQARSPSEWEGSSRSAPMSIAAQVQLVRCALQPVLAHAALQLRWAVTPAWFASGRARGAALAW